ncbi:hypothetical protein R2R35_02690 [Anaerocolumna sp. AGMB13020]|uniref:hypothetical protein n=1 Tax=Anaerocolumna sp. AGMB13020 TaxID=3081750 RepID=UPI0029551474|nr:hypothetical protein [Anaerocolumna sp. AGMB13020]WOO37420.1 hypothetical protein R2R35_02690 [Anaerocolumna sp. AGMB13020]
MKKLFCDICEKEIAPGSNRKTLVETEQILELAEITDICSDCLDKVERTAWYDVIRERINRISN